MGVPVSYRDGETRLEGYLTAARAARNGAGVLVVPTWLNVSESICRRADRIAELGYAVFVADLFGAGTEPGPPQSPLDVVAPLLKDRLLFRRRVLSALQAFQSRSECDPRRIAAVGYCLGGCGVLELARAGAPLLGVVSLHGILSAPIPAEPHGVEAKVLVLCGDADPVVPFEALVAFREEMRRAQANWQITVYAEAKHSFTGEGSVPGKTPEAVIHPQSDARSWRATVEFLQEVLLKT